MALENGHGGGEGNQRTVFVDTSLDTHLATIVSDSDTVSDLKRRIMLEHRQCFPAVGDIKVHCLKVKRRGIYYHLIDSMLVKSAFQTSQKNWFLSVDASLLEQCDGIQHNPVDQLTLPWVKDNGSTDKHDSQADRPSKISLIHGSPSNHPIIVPFVNQKVPSVVDHFTSNDSSKKVSKNVEEDRPSHDEHCRKLEPDLEQQLDSNVKMDIKSKKRTRDVPNEDTFLKKRRKTQRTKGDAKVLDEERVLTDDADADKVKDMGTNVNDENSIEDKSKRKDAGLDGVVTKAMNDEHTGTILVTKKNPKRSKKGKSSTHDQVATVVPSSVENGGEDTRDQKNTEASEVMPDVAMVVDKNILEEMPFQLSQKEKDNELVQEADIGNEIPSSLMRTSDSPKDELLVKHADDNPVVDTSSTVPTPAIHEKIIDEQTKDNSNMITAEKNQVSEKKSMDDSVVIQDKKDDDDLIVKEAKIPEPTESHRSHTHKEKSRKEVKDTAGSRKKKKNVVGKSASRKDNNDDAPTGTNEESNLSHSVMKEKMTSADALHVDRDDTVKDNDAEISKNEVKESQLIEEIPEKQNDNMDDIKKTKKKKDNDAEISINEIKESHLIEEIPEKQNDNMGDVKKPKKKKKSKTKKSGARNEGESLTKPDNGDLHEKVTDVSQVDVDTNGDKLKSKDAQISDEVLVKTPQKNHKSSSTLALESEKSEIPKEPSKTMPTESEVSKGIDGNSDVDITKEGSQGIDFHEYFSPSQQQPNKFTVLDNVDNRKDTKLLMKEMKEKKLNKKSKEQNDSKNNSGVVQSLSRNENKNLLMSPKKVPQVSTNGVGEKDRNAPDISKTKTPKPTTKINTLKTSKPVSSSETFSRSKKQQPSMSQNQVKNLKKSVTGGKSLLNTPGRSIFEDDSDDSSADDNANSNSNSSTRTPSSSSAESDTSIDSKRYGSHAVKRKQGDGKNNMNSQSRLQNRSMADLLRSSSRFKKARVTASQQINNTESEPVDFVPESQPVV